jgi:thiamine pyrophosphate-dependent acetolactate synthase large subunit-like protein
MGSERPSAAVTETAVTGAELICAQLQALGVRKVFGLMGGGNLCWVARLDRFGIDYAAASHESAAVAMADAYARTGGGPGVCTVTHGPGVTNAVTALVEASKSRTPLVMICGEIAPAERHHNQFIDQGALLRGIGCPWISVRGPDTVAADLSIAFQTAIHRRCPVVIGIPTPFQLSAVRARAVTPPPLPAQICTPGTAEIRRLAEHVRGADRIVLIGGHGAALAGAGPALRALASACGAVVGTTAMAYGLFGEDPYSLGICGGFASERAARLLQGADLILAFGASLHPWSTLGGQLIGPGAKLVQVDSDPAAIGALTPVDDGAVGDARVVAEMLELELRRAGAEQIGLRTPEIRELLGGNRGDAFEDESTATTIDPRSLMVELERLLPRRRTVIVDSGSFMVFPATMLSASEPGGFLFPQAFMSLGLGVAGAIGAATAEPERLTVLFIGDGGLAMSLGELISVSRTKHPILIVVMNDHAYGAEVHDLRELGLPHDRALLPEIDFKAVATDLGIRGVTVRSVSDCHTLAGWLDAPAGPLLVDCKINGEVKGPWHDI